MSTGLWFKHFANARQDPELNELIKEHHGLGHSVYFTALEMLRTAPNYKLLADNNGQVPHNNLSSDVAYALREKISAVKAVLEFCKVSHAGHHALLPVEDGWTTSAKLYHDALKADVLALQRQAIGREGGIASGQAKGLPIGTALGSTPVELDKIRSDKTRLEVEHLLPPTNHQLACIIQSFEQQGGIISAHSGEQLADALKQHGLEVMIRAMRIAKLKSHGDNISYILGVARSGAIEYGDTPKGDRIQVIVAGYEGLIAWDKSELKRGRVHGIVKEPYEQWDWRTETKADYEE